MVANYALGTLGSDPLQTTGIIELGGASAQVCMGFQFNFLWCSLEILMIYQYES